MSLSLIASESAKLETFVYTIMLNIKFHTQLPLNRHMNGAEGIYIDSYKECHLDSHQGDLVSDNMTKVAPTAP